ncbi:hypothetical protein [Polaromonas aquatica]|uniref:hypothetical protein n=1 Tax=Polaromonas aquatica TaxID=332657 RepID=UPI003D654313
MNFPQALGLLFLVGGIVLQPIGWAYVHWLTPASFVLIVFGVFFLFMGWRDARKDRMRKLAPEGGGPGDIHGYSGQMHGGRSTSWEASHDGIDGDGGGD